MRLFPSFLLEMPVQAVAALFFLLPLGSRASRRPYNRLQRTAQLFENALEGGGQIVAGRIEKAFKCRLYVLCLTRTRKFAIMNIE